jgi:hypothetical protein
MDRKYKWRNFRQKQNFIYLFLIAEVCHNPILVAEDWDPNHGTSLLHDMLVWPNKISESYSTNMKENHIHPWTSGKHFSKDLVNQFTTSSFVLVKYLTDTQLEICAYIEYGN